MVELSILLRKLKVDDDTLLEASFEQSKLFEEVARFRKKSLLTFLQVSSDLDVAQADAAQSIRRSYEGAGGKLTEPSIREKVRKKSRVKRLIKLKNEAEAANEYSKLLVIAFQMRKECIRVAADLLGDSASMAALPGAMERKLDTLRGSLQKRYPGSKHGPYCSVFKRIKGEKAFCSELKGHDGPHDFGRGVDG